MAFDIDILLLLKVLFFWYVSVFIETNVSLIFQFTFIMINIKFFIFRIY